MNSSGLLQTKSRANNFSLLFFMICDAFLSSGLLGHNLYTVNFTLERCWIWWVLISVYSHITTTVTKIENRFINPKNSLGSLLKPLFLVVDFLWVLVINPTDYCHGFPLQLCGFCFLTSISTDHQSPGFWLWALWVEHTDSKVFLGRVGVE